MKTAVVTGANRGLGKEVCRQLLHSGHRVILTSRREDGRATAEELSDGARTRVRWEQLDVSDVASINAFTDRLQADDVTLDYLVNNAGIHYDSYQNTLDADFAIAEEAFLVNTLGPWRLTQALYPLLRKGGGGRVVNVSSASGSFEHSWPGTPAYAVTKAALNMLTLKLSHDLKEAGILVNAVCPGWVRTRMGGPDADRSVEEGARSILWAVNIPDDGPTGGFFRDGGRLAW